MRTTLSGLFMHYAVVKFGKLGFVPAVGSAYKVAGDTLQAVDSLAATFRTHVKLRRSCLLYTSDAADD